MRFEKVADVAAQRGSSSSSQKVSSAFNVLTKPIQMTDEMRDAAPMTLQCPIYMTCMSNPYICNGDGYTYEHAAISKWLSDHDKSPVSGVNLDANGKQLTPNMHMRGLIQSHVDNFAKAAAVGASSIQGVDATEPRDRKRKKKNDGKTAKTTAATSDSTQASQLRTDLKRVGSKKVRFETT
jgi:hypothetical protein